MIRAAVFLSVPYSYEYVVYYEQELQYCAALLRVPVRVLVLVRTNTDRMVPWYRSVAGGWWLVAAVMVGDHPHTRTRTTVRVRVLLVLYLW